MDFVIRITITTRFTLPQAPMTCPQPLIKIRAKEKVLVKEKMILAKKMTKKKFEFVDFKKLTGDAKLKAIKE